MTINPPVRASSTHLLWEMRPDGEHNGEPVFACQALCHPGHSFSRFTASEAPRLDDVDGLAPVACWGCRDEARRWSDIAPRVCIPSTPAQPLTPHPPRRVDAIPRSDLL